jgi:hypothetical protein
VASVEGNIECDDESTVLERGFCLVPKENPTGESRMVPCGFSSGIYYGYLEGLQPGTLYNVRAYAKTVLGITYGADICFKTRYPPAVTTAVTEFTRTSAKVGGNIIWPDYPPVSIGDRGICFGTKTNPTVKVDWDPWILSDIVVNYGVFTCTLTDLTPGTLYYVRAYITVEDFFSTTGYHYSYEFIQYGNEVTFTTSQ